MLNNTANTAWQMRATACELLSLAFSYPDERLAEAVAAGEFAEAAQEVFGSLGASVEPATIDGLRMQGDARHVLHELRREHTRMFIGVPDAVCDPYESVWDAKARGIKPLLFVSSKSLEVERFFKSCGLGRPEGTNEPLDHVATELEALEYLASIEAGFDVVQSDMAPADLPCGSAAAAYEEFFMAHVSAWSIDFANAAIEYSDLAFYGSAAELLRVFVESESARIGR